MTQQIDRVRGRIAFELTHSRERSWDFPTRRQIFSGFRCAHDARDAHDDHGEESP
ncbi:MAG TPA: hypothetical protein VHJ83_17085 [Micromonosporaceae bacterium]|nr:hypothetical protein [Micromonosporaceae bacterium]